MFPTLLADYCDNFKAFDIEVEGNAFIHTVCISNDSVQNNKMSSIPLVMMHGIGGAIPTFYKNYKLLAIDRCVYGIDMPGFGLSKRVEFPDDPDNCERKMVKLIDQWRAKMNIDKMILLGHSFGGYVSAAYALRHHEHVQHLVLLDPWGVFSEEEDMNPEDIKGPKWFAKTLCNFLKVNPFEYFPYFGETIGGSILYLL